MEIKNPSKKHPAKVGLWCESCIAFLEHSVYLTRVGVHNVGYMKKCSNCKCENGPIFVDLSIWAEITSDYVQAK